MLKVSKFFLNLFFPKKCLGCNHPDTYLCRDCFTRLASARQDKIEISLNNTCFFCGKITWQGKICINCQKETYLDRIISATEYKNPLIRELIKAFKYHYVKELAKPLSRLLIKILQTNSPIPARHSPEATCPLRVAKQGGRELMANGSTISTNSSILIPIPLYGSRMRSRGFNQAELLAQEIANYFKLPLENNILKRILPTSPQVNIKNEEKRKANIKNAFEVLEPSRVQGKIIILIDDVATTGATLIEAAKILKKSGAKEVWALVVAKG